MPDLKANILTVKIFLCLSQGRTVPATETWSSPATYDELMAGLPTDLTLLQ